MNFVCKTIRDTSFSACQTKNITLSGGDFESADAVETYIQRCVGECKQIFLDEKRVRQLVYKYGSNTDQIISRIFDTFQDYTNKTHCYIDAEVWYTVENEMTLTLCDFAIRRTGNLYFNRPELVEHYEYIAECMSSYLGWDEKRKLQELSDFEKEMKAVLNF